MKRLLAALSLALALGVGGAAMAEPTPPRFGDGVQSKRAPIQAPKDRPAQGSPYNWKQMGFAAVLMLATLGGLLVAIRRATRHKR